MSVAEMEQRFYELKGKLDVGALSESEFKAEIEKLRFQDAQNRWWMIGAQSGKWYMYDGTRWIPGQPPAESAVMTLPLPPEPRPPTQPPVKIEEPSSVQVAAAPRSPSTLLTGTAPMAVEPRAPKLMPIPKYRREAKPFVLPRGPIVIGCGALGAIVLVIIFWLAVENLVPGHPISTALGSFTGSKLSGTVSPTRSATLVATNGNGAAQLIAAGDEFVAQSQFDPAFAQYQVAAQMAQTNATPLSRWARALAFRGQMSDALSKVRQATQRAPNDAEAQAQLARILAWSGQVPDAIAAGEKALQLDPKSANAHAYMAEVYLLAKRPADAQTQAQTALQLAPTSAEAHRAQAWVWTLGGQKDNALAEWRQTVALEPNLFFRHFELGEVLRVFFNDPLNAVSEYQKALALFGAYVPAYNRLGLAYLDANLPQQAVPQFQHAITLDPNNAENFAYLGLAFGKADQCPQAIPYFEQALRVDANNGAAAKGLSDCQGGKPPTAPSVPAPTMPFIPPTLVASGAPPVPVPTVAKP